MGKQHRNRKEIIRNRLVLVGKFTPNNTPIKICVIDLRKTPFLNAKSARSKI